MKEDGIGWNGGIRFQLASKEQAMPFATQARSYAVVLGYYTTCLDVHSPFLPDWVTALTTDSRLGFRIIKAHSRAG